MAGRFFLPQNNNNIKNMIDYYLLFIAKSLKALLGHPEGRPLQQVWRTKLCLSVCLSVCMSVVKV